MIKAFKVCAMALSLTCTHNLVFAQELISTAGESFSNGNVSIDYAIGELVILTGTTTDGFVTQGYNQPNWNYLFLNEESETYSIQVFPNPTVNELHIDCENCAGLVFEIRNPIGKIVKTGILNSDKNLLFINALAKGCYQLNLIENKQLIQSIKLIKN